MNKFLFSWGGLGGLLFALFSIAQAATVEISVEHLAKMGHPTSIDITVDSLTYEISGFDILVAIDQRSYPFTGAEPGQTYNDCGWEYFMYRLYPDTSSLFPLGEDYTHLVNLTGFASITDGYTPLCYGSGESFDLARISFIVGLPHQGHQIDCMWFPIRFFWRTCGDNVLYSKNNDTVYTADALFEYNGYPQPYPVTYPYPGFGIPDPPCSDPPGQSAVSELSFYNGGLDIACPEILLKGDVNLNGIHYEAADMVLLTSYFIWGIIIFVRPSEQLEQCDINSDGLISVADCIYMYRIVLGDTPPMGVPFKSSPATLTATFRRGSGSYSFGVETERAVGALYLRLVGKGGVLPDDVKFSGVAFRMGAIGDTTTMLLINEDGTPVIPAGHHRLFEIPGDRIRLVEIQAADEDGIPFDITLKQSARPTDFSLRQNYPNPFNPSTVISFTLAERREWSLEIYNVMGRAVRSFAGEDEGEVSVVWDGCNTFGQPVASGVYFYRLEAAGSAETKKMLLVR